MKNVTVKTAADITAYITIPLEMLYCILCALLITLPLYVFLNIGYKVLMLFAEQRVEKTSNKQIIKRS